MLGYKPAQILNYLHNKIQAFTQLRHVIQVKCALAFILKIILIITIIITIIKLLYYKHNHRYKSLIYFGRKDIHTTLPIWA